MRAWFQRVVLHRPVLAFMGLVAGFLGFGLASLNLVYVLRANANFLYENGWTAVADGGLWQLGQILLNAVVAMAAYVVFKSCEHALVHWVSDPAARRSHGVPETATATDRSEEEGTP